MTKSAHQQVSVCNAAASSCARSSARSSGASKSRNVQIRGWPAIAPRGLPPAGSEPSDGVVELDTSCRPIRTTGRSATAISANAKTFGKQATRQHERHRKDVRCRLPGVASWSASIALRLLAPARVRRTVDLARRRLPEAAQYASSFNASSGPPRSPLRCAPRPGKDLVGSTAVRWRPR
jgi:hypothetical protein